MHHIWSVALYVNHEWSYSLCFAVDQIGPTIVWRLSKLLSNLIEAKWNQATVPNSNYTVSIRLFLSCSLCFNNVFLFFPLWMLDQGCSNIFKTDYPLAHVTGLKKNWSSWSSWLLQWNLSSNFSWFICYLLGISRVSDFLFPLIFVIAACEKNSLARF